MKIRDWKSAEEQKYNEAEKVEHISLLCCWLALVLAPDSLTGCKRFDLHWYCVFNSFSAMHLKLYMDSEFNRLRHNKTYSSALRCLETLIKIIFLTSSFSNYNNIAYNHIKGIIPTMNMMLGAC